VTALAAGQTTSAARAEADQINASVREDYRALVERTRRAAQLVYESDLADAAKDCLAELTGVRSRGPALETTVQDAVTAERAAQDRLRAETGKLTRVESEQAKADPGDGDVQEKLALRLHARRGAVDACRGAVADAAACLAAAEQARDRWQAHVNALEAGHREAARQAENPGPAPDRPGMPLGIARPSDYDGETRKAIAAALIAVSMTPSGGSEPSGLKAKGGLGVTRGGLAAQDPGGFRFARFGGGAVAIPPAR